MSNSPHIYSIALKTKSYRVLVDRSEVADERMRMSPRVFGKALELDWDKRIHL